MEQPAKTVTISEIFLDRQRHLRFDFNALARLEEITGKNMLKPENWDNLNVTNLRAFLWAGLLHEDPDLTLEQVGAMIHPGNLQTVASAIASAFGREQEPSPLVQ